MKTLIVLFLLFWAAPIQAWTGFGDWNADQKYLWGAYTLVWAADLGQTRYIALSAGHKEYYGQWALTETPSVGRVHNVFAAWYVTNYVICGLLPDNLRGIWLIGAVLGHGTMIGNNHALGIGFDFDF